MFTTCHFCLWRPYATLLILVLLNVYDVVLALDREMIVEDYSYCKLLGYLTGHQ